MARELLAGDTAYECDPRRPTTKGRATWERYAPISMPAPEPDWLRYVRERTRPGGFAQPGTWICAAKE
jgi:hypothetical protein